MSVRLAVVDDLDLTVRTIEIMPNAQIHRLQAATVDGRAHNVYFRQTQLERLCKSLLAEEAAFRQAMISDSDYTPSEAIAVFHVTTQTVKDLYATLQPVQALEKEYRVAHGKDAADGARPCGVVYIEPEAHTLLYSVCAPLCAAIAAGNCVIVLVGTGPINGFRCTRLTSQPARKQSSTTARPDSQSSHRCLGRKHLHHRLFANQGQPVPGRRHRHPKAD